ncbi:MAG: DUF4397 domain-containing protein [Pedobacter sp.]|nr:MAG: DUF4397 domain-containing protein [Pedobacter sp.]
MKKLLYLFIATVGFLTACEKGELVESTKYETLTPGDPKYSYIKILNLTPGSPALTYFIDGKKFSAALSSTGVENAGWAYNGLFPDLGYAVTAPGTRTLTAKTIPSLTVDPNLEVLNTQVTVNAGKYYTLYTTGMYTTTNKKIGSTLLVEECTISCCPSSFTLTCGDCVPADSVIWITSSHMDINLT